jgi:DUF917 family protein
MPYGRLETKQDCQDFVEGCLFMGTGGGGDAAWGLEVLYQALADGLRLEWVAVDDIADDLLTVTPFGMGSIAPLTTEVLTEIAAAGLVGEFAHTSMDEAVKELQEYLGRRIGCLVPVELGAGNTPGPLVAGARLGIPVVDGDYAGRAIPDEMQGTPFLNGKQSWPSSSVDKWGNVSIITRAVNPYMFERYGKMLSIAAYDGTSMAATPLPGVEMKEIVVRGTLSKCLALGRAMRLARERGADPVETAVTLTGGWRLFEGVVVEKAWEDRDGYMFGTTPICAAPAPMKAKN